MAMCLGVSNGEFILNDPLLAAKRDILTELIAHLLLNL